MKIKITPEQLGVIQSALVRLTVTCEGDNINPTYRQHAVDLYRYLQREYILKPSEYTKWQDEQWRKMKEEKSEERRGKK